MITNNTLCATVTGAIHILSSYCSTALIRSCLSVVKLGFEQHWIVYIRFNIPGCYVWHEYSLSSMCQRHGDCVTPEESAAVWLYSMCVTFCITIQVRCWHFVHGYETTTRHEACNVFIMHYSIWHLLKIALFLHFKWSLYKEISDKELYMMPAFWCFQTNEIKKRSDTVNIKSWWIESSYNAATPCPLLTLVMKRLSSQA